MINLDDYIIVEHKSGSRKPQKVKKYRATCDVCQKDREYVFKAQAALPCLSCSSKTSYKKGRGVNDNRQTLKVVKNHPTQGEITLKSSYELFFYNYLRSKKKEFLYEPERFDLGEKGSYLPDFFVEGRYVELKGVFRDSDLAKMAEFRRVYPDKPLDVFGYEDLKKLGYRHEDYKKSHVFNVIGEPWLAVFMDFKEYAAVCGDDSKGLTDTEKKRIYVNLRTSDLETIRHEIGHAYAAQMSLTELQLDEDQIEEFFCEIIGKYGKYIINQAEDIYREFTRLRRRVVGKKHEC